MSSVNRKNIESLNFKKSSEATTNPGNFENNVTDYLINNKNSLNKPVRKR